MGIVDRKRYLTGFERELVFEGLWSGQIVGCKHGRCHGSCRREWVGIPMLSAILAVVSHLILIIVLLASEVGKEPLRVQQCASSPVISLRCLIVL